MMAFRRVDFDLPVEQFHALDFRGAGDQLWVPRLDRGRTLVLGSTQPIELIDRARTEDQGVSVARRRSGGGMVLVGADDVIWADVIIDHTNHNWTSDVGLAFEWVGAACSRALDTLGHPTEMHTGRPAPSSWPEICFAGLGPGELVLDGRKVVGISQRRTRDCARFQIAILRRWRAADYTSLLAVDDATRAAASIALETMATGVATPPELVIEALHRALGDT